MQKCLGQLNKLATANPDKVYYTDRVSVLRALDLDILLQRVDARSDAMMALFHQDEYRIGAEQHLQPDDIKRWLASDSFNKPVPCTHGLQDMPPLLSRHLLEVP